MSAGGHVAIQDIERISGVSRLEQWSGAGGTSLRLRTILDSGLIAAGAWAVIAPYTAQCEVRAISSYENRDLTVAALTYAHDPDTAVLVINEPKIYDRWFSVGAGQTAANNTTRLQAAIDAAEAGGLELVITRDTGAKEINNRLVVDAAGVKISFEPGAEIEQTGAYTAGGATAPWMVFDIRAASSVIIQGPRLTSTVAKGDVSAGTVDDVLGDGDTANAFNLCCGIHQEGSCSNLVIVGPIYIKGFVYGILIRGEASEYTDHLTIGDGYYEDVDWALGASKLRDPNIGVIQTKNINATQGEPTHAVYLFDNALDGQGGRIAYVYGEDIEDCRAVLQVKSHDDLEVGGVYAKGGQAVTVLNCKRIHLGNVIGIQDAVDVTGVGIVSCTDVEECVIDNLYTETDQQVYGVAAIISAGAQCWIKVGQWRHVNTQASSVTKALHISGSGAKVWLHQPQFVYSNTIDGVVYLTGGGSCDIYRPYCTNNDRFLDAQTGCNDWRLVLDKTLFDALPVDLVQSADGDYNGIITLPGPVFEDSFATIQLYVYQHTTVKVSGLSANKTLSIQRLNEGHVFTIYNGDSTYNVNCNPASETDFATKSGANLALTPGQWATFMVIDGKAREIS